MKRTLLFVGLIALTGALVTYCGGGGGGAAKDPTAAKTEFTSPTGTITSGNAADVLTEALNSSAGNPDNLSGFGIPNLSKIAVTNTLGKYSPKFRAVTAESCVSASSDGKSATIDVGCLATQETGCTGSGSISYAIAADLFTIDINNVSFSCTGDVTVVGWNGQMLFLFSGDIQTATADLELWLVCADITGTIDGQVESFNGCVGIGGDYAGHYLVDGEGGSVVCTGITLGDSCATVTGNFTTSAGDVSVTCDVTAPASCTDWVDIESVDNCVIN
jgi:hypothetical protein